MQLRIEYCINNDVSVKPGTVVKIDAEFHFSSINVC